MNHKLLRSGMESVRTATEAVQVLNEFSRLLPSEVPDGTWRVGIKATHGVTNSVGDVCSSMCEITFNNLDAALDESIEHPNIQCIRIHGSQHRKPGSLKNGDVAIEFTDGTRRRYLLLENYNRGGSIIIYPVNVVLWDKQFYHYETEVVEWLMKATTDELQEWYKKNPALTVDKQREEEAYPWKLTLR